MGKPNQLSFIRPEKSPFFYGYFILLFGTIGVWASLPGQTIGVGTFTDPVKDALGITRNQISIAYFIGTLVSSLFLHKAGKWFDKYGARHLAFFASIGLAISLFLCSKADVISEKLAAFLNIQHFLLPTAVITILFFMLRFSGQGVLTLASRNMIMNWFDQLRGRVNAISAVAVSLGFSASPLWINALIDKTGWKNAWLYMAGGVLIAGIIFHQFFRNNPEDHNLLPDGKKLSTNENNKNQQKQFSLKEAKRTRSFWVYALSLSFYSFFVTGLTFHIIAVFKSVGQTSQQAIAIFIPMAVISVSVSLVANFISDWIKLKYLLYINILGGILASVGLIFLSHNIGLYLLVGGSGIMGGLFSVLISITWPRFFGRKHLGAISGKSMSMIVLASALGPSLFSFSKTLFSTFAEIGVISIPFLLGIALAAKKANNPQ